MSEEKTEFKPYAVTCSEVAILQGNDVAPPLIKDQEYMVLEEYRCRCKEIHYNVGLTPTVNQVTCYKCREVLPKAGHIHWCHSSRFQ